MWLRFRITPDRSKRVSGRAISTCCNCARRQSTRTAGSLCSSKKPGSGFRLLLMKSNSSPLPRSGVRQSDIHLLQLRAEAINQDRRVSMLLEEARKRLPAPLDEKQLVTITEIGCPAERYPPAATARGGNQPGPPGLYAPRRSPEAASGSS